MPAFLDIESTSLHADMGMLVCAVLRQNGRDRVYFVDRPRLERSVLERLLRKIGGVECLVTFNGRSFDLPFLASRALILGIQDIPAITCRQVDLFESLKKVLRFDKLSLDHVARVLGIEFDSSLTGREVPHMYLTYLSERKKEMRERVIRHCVSDVDLMEKVYLKLDALMNLEGLER